MTTVPVGVLGATSLVAEFLTPLLQSSYLVVPFSRRLTSVPTPLDGKPARIPYWISLMPISALPDWFEVLATSGATRVVALSSTGVLTKSTSSNPAERALAASLLCGERRLTHWAQARNVEWVILRSTLIYGAGRDRNITEIARFIHRFGFFPILGEASGLRQPIHAEDVARACQRALAAKYIANRSYNISGGETLSYREMVSRIFEGLGKRTRLLRVPFWLFQAAITTARALPRFRDWSVAMVERMNQDLVFDHGEVERDLHLSLRPFQPQTKDLPVPKAKIIRPGLTHAPVKK